MSDLKPASIYTPSLLLIFMFLHILYGSLMSGIAYDEMFHIPEGVAYSTFGFRKLVPAHTPLGHALAGLSMKFVEPVIDSEFYLSPKAEPFEMARRFFWTGVNNTRFILIVARIPFIFMGVLTAFYAFLLSKKLWGENAGFATLLLSSFCPSIIAWSRFVYMDVPATFFIIGTIYCLWKVIQERSKLDLLFLGIFLGGTISSKYSGLSILPFVGTVLIFPWGFSKNAISISFRKAIIDGLIVAIFMTIVTWICFNCPSSPTFYFDGMKHLYSDMNPDFRYYLMGEFKSGGWWYYFPIQIFLKLSAPVLIFSVIIFVIIARKLLESIRSFSFKNIDEDSLKILFLLYPATLFLIATCMKAIPIGSRYIIPVLPFFYVASGYLFKKFSKSEYKLASKFLWICIFIHVWCCASIFPDEMAYFNEFIGGPNQGILWTNDASIDAGQNLPRLAAYLRSRGNPPIRILYQGVDSPEYYGIKKEVASQTDWDGNPRPGLYAVSANWLVYGQLDSRERTTPPHKDWLKTFKPIKQIGGSIWIYEFK